MNTNTFTLLPGFRIACQTADTAVTLALRDVVRDTESALGLPATVVGEGPAEITASFDPSLGGEEAHELIVGESGVTVRGGGPLGLVYGLYLFSRECLGVDPYWYWKSLRPARRERIPLVSRVIRPPSATFRYRGWFLNDEDLLCEFMTPSGHREIDYPFYRDVMNLDLADRVFETLLRAGQNLVIPGSFIDVMNPDEAALVERAVARGLYVTQHHAEPLGVSHFGFESYWRRRGETAVFQYGADPARVERTWRDYAVRWRELAGDRVVWQLGLRGRGDRPIWHSDDSVSRDRAGAFISRAIERQWRIVRDVDPRPQPPATTTLWIEGSQLMRDGALTLPEDTMIVFCDNGATQQLQEDFHLTPRLPRHRYGVYYHAAFWHIGPHLAQGLPPDRLRANIETAIGRGDTALWITNVSNIREHLLGVQAVDENTVGAEKWSEPDFWARWCPRALHPLYTRFFSSFLRLRNTTTLQAEAVLVEDNGCRHSQDGVCRAALLETLESGALPETYWPENAASLSDASTIYAGAADEFAAVAREGECHGEAVESPHLWFNLVHQSRILAACHRFVAAAAVNDYAAVDKALAELAEVLGSASAAPWENWYRGERKFNVGALRARVRSHLDRTAAGATAG